MARSSHLARRNGGRYYLQIRLKSFSGRSPSRLVRFSLETCDYAHARVSVAERMSWLIPLQASRSAQQRYNHISAQLDAFNAQGEVTHREKLAARCNFEHVVRGLIDDMGGLKDDGAFNTAWMIFCQENLIAEKRIATDDRLDAYERGRADALKTLGITSPTAMSAAPPPLPPFDPTRPDHGIVLTGQGNGRDTAGSDINVILAREVVFNTGSGNTASHSAIRPTTGLAPIVGEALTDNAITPNTPLHASEKSDANMVLSDFFEEFLASRRARDGDGRGRSEIGPIVEFTVRLLDDKHPSAYTRQDFARLNREIPKIPTTKNIPAKYGRSLFARYEYACSNPNAKLVTTTEGTIKKNYHSGLKRFFSWLRKQQLMKSEPVLDLVTPENRVTLPRDSFDDAEILKFLQTPLFTGCRSRERCWSPGQNLIQASLYWQYLILFLTGMRPGEVGSLKLKDLVEAEGFCCFDLRPFDARKGRVTIAEIKALKTQTSARIVPIHPLLIELGLLDHRDAMVRAGHSRLLPDCEPYIKPDGQIRWSQEITKSWQYVRGKYGFLRRADITLYSSRHTMAQMIDDLKLPARTRDRVMGHANTASSAGNYGRNGMLTTEEFKEFTGITNPLIDAMRDILLPPKRAADAGTMTLLRSVAPLQAKFGKT